jgi:hypothetical protein
MHMLRNLLGTSVILACMAGCATKPVAVSDNTPLNPTAVIEQHVVNDGIKGFFPFESTDRHYVRATMRRDESTLKGTGTFTGYLVGTQSETKIARIDRNVQWLLNTEKEEYSECPLRGCVEPAGRPAAKQEAKQPPAEPHKAGCTMHIAHTRFTVKATGQKKTINGFDTDEYQVAWVVKLRDKEARNTISTLNLDIWTTPETQDMREALGMEEKYARAYAGHVGDEGKRELVPGDAARLMTAYLASFLKSHDIKAFLNAGRQMEKIKGYPISTHLQWDMAGNACEDREARKTESQSSSKSIPGSPGDLVSGLAGMFAEKKTKDALQEAKGEPILSFRLEVKSLKVEPLHDSVFTVPRNYRLVPQP